MDLFGIGPPEILVVLLVALLVLGPSRMVEMARNLGKFWREAQQTLRQAADMATVKLDEPVNPRVPREPVEAPEESIARDDDTSAEPASGSPAAAPPLPERGGAKAEADPGQFGRS